MNQRVSLGVWVGGVLVMIFCISATNSFGFDVSPFGPGSPAGRAMGTLIGGVVMCTVGALAVFREPKSI